jgi:branched-chain amino acid aminotransferase
VTGEFIYLNGQYVAGDAARLPVWDYAVVQAATVTDMVRTFRGEPFRLPEHLRRFAASREALGLELPEGDRKLAKIVAEVIQRTRSLVGDTDFGIVMFASPGEYPGYAGYLADSPANGPRPARSKKTKSRPTLCIHPFPLRHEEYARGYREGVALAIPSVRQVATDCLPPSIKCRSRLHWYLAEREVRSQDPAAAALLLDSGGFVTETATGNLFVVRGRTLLTPRAETTLAGISQQFVIELCRSEGITVERADLIPQDVRESDEVLLSSTTYCLMPVARLDGQPIGRGRPGPMFARLMELWSQEVDVNLIGDAPRSTPKAATIGDADLTRSAGTYS